MLSIPKNGWTIFGLKENKYQLSHLTDVANDWLEEAIHGLETLNPFTVHGFLEGWRMICTVSYWNTHIFVEDDENVELDIEKSNYEIVHIRMIDFCQMLYDDINNNIDEWTKWGLDEEDDDLNANKQNLKDSLLRLQELIDIQKDNFSENRCFC